LQLYVSRIMYERQESGGGFEAPSTIEEAFGRSLNEEMVPVLRRIRRRGEGKTFGDRRAESE
jgi:hypothetical protein